MFEKLKSLPRPLLIALAAVLAVGLFAVVRSGPEQRTVTAHFSRAVAIYPSSEVRILGVKVGEVKSVVPEGNTVRVEMVYDAEYPVPADAQAVIITPTLTADRFVQLSPAYTAGPKLADDAQIEVKDTGTPVELDRIYKSLSVLTEALGPNGVNKDGTLDHFLSAGAKFLDGEGRKANTTIVNLSRAMKTFGDGSGELFGTVNALNQFTGALAANDRAVASFMDNLGAVSQQLAGEKDALYGALKNLADVLGKVERFVKSNRGLLSSNVRDLATILRTIAAEQSALATVLDVGPLAMGNLVTAFDPVTGSIGSRIGFENNVVTMDDLLCAAVKQAKLPAAATACALFKSLLGPARSGRDAAPSSGPTQASTLARYGTGTAATDLSDLLGGAS